MLHSHFSADLSPNCAGAHQSAAKQSLQKILSVCFNSPREPMLALKDVITIAESLNLFKVGLFCCT